MTEIRTTTLLRLITISEHEFKRAGLSNDDARDEATSFAYSAAEILRDRLDEQKES